LDRLNTDPDFVAKIGSLGAVPLLNQALRALSVLPQMIDCERTALGLTATTIEELTNRNRTADTFADKIPGNPEAVEAAIALLDAMVRP
jgi:hypothetical protein